MIIFRTSTIILWFTAGGGDGLNSAPDGGGGGCIIMNNYMHITTAKTAPNDLFAKTSRTTDAMVFICMEYLFIKITCGVIPYLLEYAKLIIDKIDFIFYNSKINN